MNNPYSLPGPSPIIKEEEFKSSLTPKHQELLKRLQKLFPECCIKEEPNITLHNIGGYPYAQGPGISYMRVTSSYADGPEFDFFPEIKELLCNMGFSLESYYTSGCDERNYENYEVYYFIEKESLKYI